MPIPGSAAPSCVMQGSPERGRALSTPTASYSSGAWMCHQTELNGVKIGWSRGVEEISVQWHELPTATDAVVVSWPAPWHGEGPRVTSPCWWPGNATHSCPPVLVVNHLLLTPAKKDLQKPPHKQINVNICRDKSSWLQTSQCLTLLQIGMDPTILFFWTLLYWLPSSWCLSSVFPLHRFLMQQCCKKIKYYFSLDDVIWLWAWGKLSGSRWGRELRWRSGKWHLLEAWVTMLLLCM